jgi:hypothetical protein
VFFVDAAVSQFCCHHWRLCHWPSSWIRNGKDGIKQHFWWESIEEAYYYQCCLCLVVLAQVMTSLMTSCGTCFGGVFKSSLAGHVCYLAGRWACESYCTREKPKKYLCLMVWAKRGAYTLHASYEHNIERKQFWNRPTGERRTHDKQCMKYL